MRLHGTVAAFCALWTGLLTLISYVAVRNFKETDPEWYKTRFTRALWVMGFITIILIGLIFVG
jgi:hypothetical protein